MTRVRIPAPALPFLLPRERRNPYGRARPRFGPVPTPVQVTLREIRPGDIAVIYEQQRDPAATAMAAFPPRDRASHDAHWAKILATPSVTTRAVIVGGEVAGQIGSWEQDGRRLVGYWIGRPFWGKGVATAALKAHLEIDRQRPIRAFVAVQNVASIRVLEKCGFHRVGMERGVSLRGGPPVDEYVMELSGDGGA
jgi:RimJ/RimL family protein N-acetyltransferase